MQLSNGKSITTFQSMAVDPSKGTIASLLESDFSGLQVYAAE
jgi:hypothetical protein